MSARCEGTRIGFKLLCNGTQYKCLACGTVGCKQNKPGVCSSQNFSSLNACAQCGVSGQMDMLAPEAVGFRQTLMHDGVDA